jgi:hypothetical protein
MTAQAIAVLKRVDDMLNAQRVLELDAMLDRVFPRECAGRFVGVTPTVAWLAEGKLPNGRWPGWRHLNSMHKLSRRFWSHALMAERGGTSAVGSWRCRNRIA